MSSYKFQKYRSWVEIDLDSFRNNLSQIKKLLNPSVKILQVVKADAYGHGAIEISNCALRNGASYLGVANADEGVQLRVGGINAPILILSPSTVYEIDDIIKYNLIPSVSDYFCAREFDRSLKKEGKLIPVHIEIDTGMGRGGLFHEKALAEIEKIFRLPNIGIEGIFSHLSSSDVRGDDHNVLQWERFRELLQKLGRAGISIPLKHLSNSGGILHFPGFQLTMVRPGIMTYGIYPAPHIETAVRLMPVMSFKTNIILLKDLPKDCSIGYNRTYQTAGPAKIATIPVGYGDGYGFVLSNQGEVLVRGQRAPIVGRVSMDMCTVDVSHIPDCEIGDEVVLMGQQGNEIISADDIAAKAQTISYEIPCVVGKRAPRVFVNKGRPDTVEPRLRRIFLPHEERSIARIDSMIRSCFQARIQNVELGNAIYYEMFEALFGKVDRQLELRSCFKYTIKVNEFSREEIEALPQNSDYLKVTTHIEYNKTLKNDFFIIGCALNNEQLAAFFEDERCEYRWLLSSRDDQLGERDFRVARVRIDGENVPVISAENTARGYEVWCGGDIVRKKLEQQVRFEIEIETKKYKSSNTFSVYLVYPTRGLDISFHYGGTSLRNVREISFFAGRHPYPAVMKEKGKSIRLKVSEDDWIFPNSGVTFIWDV